MDPLDEFEFKPLTDGLGFHKKAEKIKESVRSTPLAREKTAVSVPELPPRSVLFSPSEIESEVLGERGAEVDRPASQSIKELIASLPPSLDFTDEKETPGEASTKPHVRPQIFQPVGRPDYSSPVKGPTIGNYLPHAGAATEYHQSAAPLMGPVASAPATSGSLPPPGSYVVPPTSSTYQHRLNESYARAFPHADKVKRVVEPVEEPATLLEVSAHPGAGILDGMVSVGLTTILLVCVLAITRINLIGLLSHGQTADVVWFQLALLFFIVVQVYMLVSRVFFGASLGEWAFDLQLGTEEDRSKMWFFSKVFWRTLIVTCSGFVLFPLLSLLSRRDVLKYITRLQLYRRS